MSLGTTPENDTRMTGAKQKSRGKKLLLVSSLVILVTLALVIAAIKLYAETHISVPAIPQYPGALIIDMPLDKSSRDQEPAAHLVMQVSGDLLDAFMEYSTVLIKAGWTGGKICQSGMPGTHVWRKSGQWPFDPGWVAHVETEHNDTNGNYIEVTVWRGSDVPDGTCVGF